MAIPHDRVAFTHYLRLWFAQTGHSSDSIPKIGERPLDLHQLFIQTEALGGLDKVYVTSLWRLVALEMGYMMHEQNNPQLAQVAKVLADTYIALLVPLDSFCMDRMRVVGTAIQDNRLNQVGIPPQVGVGTNHAVPSGLLEEPAGIVHSNGGASALSVADLQRVFAFLQTKLRNWLPEVLPQTKLLHAAQMDLPAMQREGWPADLIQVMLRFQPALVQSRDWIFQQQLHQQAPSQQGMQQQNAHTQAHTVQVQQFAQQQHVSDRLSLSGGILLPEVQARNFHDTGMSKGLPFTPEAAKRARAIVGSISREIEQTRQYNRLEVPETERAQMYQTVAAAYAFSVEFERTVVLYYMVFNDQQRTRDLMEQAMLLREQRRMLQSGQQQYIMRPEEVISVHHSLRIAIHQLKTTYSQKLKQHQEQMVSLRVAEAGGPTMGQQLPNAPAEDVSAMLRGVEQNRQLFPSLAANPVSPTPSGNHIQRGSQKVPRRQEAPQQVEVPPPPASLPSGGSQAEKPIVRMTKRRLEKEHEENAEEQSAALKRGKIIHRNYANTSLNNVDSHLHNKYAADGTIQDTGTGDPAHNSQSIAETKPGQMSCEEIFQHLLKHGCVDLSPHMDPEQYSSELIIGGAFGDVWKGKLRDGTEVAIKVWRFSSLLHNGWKFVKRAMREIYYWSKAKHKYVQELMGVILFQGRLGMVSRWMDHGNLREYICKNPSVDRYVICIQVATGIAYLHSQAMVHGDLKGINILVSCDGVAKLSDFDHSIMLGCSLVFSDTSKLGGGTTRWMAPELILEDNCSRSAYTDVYSLGMTMFEIITGTSPYYPQCREDIHVMKAIMKKTLPTRPMDHLSDNMRDNRMWELLLSCWNYDPLARPKATEVVESLQFIINLPVNGPI